MTNPENDIARKRLLGNLFIFGGTMAIVVPTVLNGLYKGGLLHFHGNFFSKENLPALVIFFGIIMFVFLIIVGTFIRRALRRRSMLRFSLANGFEFDPAPGDEVGLGPVGRNPEGFPPHAVVVMANIPYGGSRFADSALPRCDFCRLEHSSFGAMIMTEKSMPPTAKLFLTAILCFFTWSCAGPGILLIDLKKHPQYPIAATLDSAGRIVLLNGDNSVSTVSLGQNGHAPIVVERVPMNPKCRYVTHIAVGNDGDIYELAHNSEFGAAHVCWLNKYGHIHVYNNNGKDFESGDGLAVDSRGNMLVASIKDGAIYRIAPDGRSVMLGGPPSGGAPLSITLIEPGTLVLDSDNDLYFASGHAIFRISANGALSRFAGDPLSSGNQDGEGISARFDNLWSMTWSPDNALYILDAPPFWTATSDVYIRRIDCFTGKVSTLVSRYGWESGQGQGVLMSHDSGMIVLNSSWHGIYRQAPSRKFVPVFHVDVHGTLTGDQP